MSELLLTIVTVTKNCAATIDRTLDSVEAVKQKGVEYMVVDGVSTDATLEAIHARAGLVDRLVSEPDSGIYNAMNKGVRLARGRYVLFINGDDAIVADGFAAVLDVMARGKDGIICATTLVGEFASPAETLIAKPWLLPFFNSIPHTSSFVMRKLLLTSNFREDLCIVSDYDFFLRAYLSGQSFKILPVVTALHQRGGASGNVERSRAELKLVRRERLGWRYPFINSVSAMYSNGKYLVRKIIK
jgi:glycosyltransferase involved in cell wall biosynthesis